jgi:hypothetical protein
VLLAFVPTLALYAHAGQSLKSAEVRHHESELLHLANQAGHEYRRILRDTESLLAALAEMSEFKTPRQPACNDALAAVMSHMEHYTAIQLIEPDGFVACGSLALDGELYVGDRYYHQAVVANNRFVVGDFVVGRLTGKPIVGLAYPVHGDGPADVVGVLAAYLDLDALSNAIYDLDVPRAATLTMLDREGTIMIRVPSGMSTEHADTVGATVPEVFPVPTGEILDAYLLTGSDLDGVARRFAVQPLEAGGRMASGHLLIGRTQEAMLADAEVFGARRLQLLAVAAVFMFLLAWMFGHYTLLRDPPVGVSTVGAPTPT